MTIINKKHTDIVEQTRQELAEISDKQGPTQNPTPVQVPTAVQTPTAAQVSTPVPPSPELTQQQFEWLTRLSRLSGASSMIIDKNLNIVFYDPTLFATVELDKVLGTQKSYVGKSMLDFVTILIQRGDLGKGDPEQLKQAIQLHLTSKSDLGGKRVERIEIATPSGRRIKIQRDLELGEHILISALDITEKYNDKHALRIALKSSLSTFFIYQCETKSFRVSKGAGMHNVTKRLKRLLEAGRYEDLIHVDDRAKAAAEWKQGLKSKKAWESSFRFINPKKKNRWVRIHATPQFSDSNVMTSVIVFCSDITSQLRTQEKLHQAIDQSEKMLSAKNEFLGRLSHEIRTPMNAVVGIADALIHHNKDPKIIPKLELMQDSAAKIIRIVDETLEHTKLEEDMMVLNPESASPTTSVTNVCALWQEQAIKNNTKLSSQIDPSVPELIMFDQHRYEQCLNNLVSNAIKFAPGGTVKIILTTIDKDDNTHLVLAVKDTGIGMSETQLEGLFDAFTQADETISKKFGGSGLGMSITKKIIELMGGSISARSVIGSGTVIALTVPIKAERRTAERRQASGSLVEDILTNAATDEAESAYAHLRVLVVDDNPTNHLVARSLIEPLVAEVLVAEDGQQAIDMLGEHEIDVVFMDIHMPVMDGIEATLSIRSSQAAYATVPIVALTADPQYQQKRLCKNIGMDDALSKPVKLAHVLGALDRLDIKKEELDQAVA